MPIRSKVTVIKAGAEWKILSVNDIGDEITRRHVYVRTRGAMYCFAQPVLRQ